MATPILSRLARLFKAHANDTLDKLEDPGATARQMVRDLESAVAQSEEAVAAIIGDRNVLQKKRDDATAAAADWTSKAKTAVLASRDDLATEALKRAGRASENAAAYDAALKAITPKVDVLRARLVELREKKAAAANEVTLLDARAKAANATAQAARLIGGVGANPVDLVGVRERVDKMEAGAAAMVELSDDKTGADIGDELAALTQTPVAERLAALKADVASHSAEVS